MLNWLFTSTPLLFFTQSFWRDEAFSYFLAKKNIVEIIVLSAKDFTPPLYQLLIHFWLKFFGSSEVALRSFSLIFFWATLYFSFLFLKDIFKLSTKKSLFYLLLFILNPFLSYYAFEARTYSFFAFLVTLSYFYFYKKNFKIYLIVTTLALYTHYFMLFVILSQLLFRVISEKSRSGLRLAGFLSRIKLLRNDLTIWPLFLFTPWVLFVLTQKNLSSSFWLERTNSKTFVSLLSTVFTGFENSAGWISLLLLLIFTIAFVKIKNKKYSQDSQLFIYLFLWGIGIPLLVAIISLVKPIYFPRYFIFSSVGLLMLIIYSLEKMKFKARILAIILLIFAIIQYQNISLQKHTKTNFKKASQEVKTLLKKEDMIYVTNELDFFTAKYYFQENKVMIYNKTYEEIPDFVGKVLINKSDIAPALPFYPQRAIILKSSGSYNVQALY